MTKEARDPTPRAGWISDLPTFRSTEPRIVRLSLEHFVTAPGPDQISAWKGWIPDLQREANSLLHVHEPAAEYTAILEYELPRDQRRPDVVILEGGVVVVLELKGPQTGLQAGLDQAAAKKERHVVMLTGVPGSGKTLVGLQLVHANWLSPLAVPRQGNTPTVPAVFLSGNGPLVAVLQDALASAGGGGKTFVQDIKRYVKTYSKKRAPTPPEHLVVFDEAQRAHDAERVAHVHDADVAQSEPEHLLEFMLRVPEWSVLVALVGTGQAIHVGEEGGIALWRDALAKLAHGNWIVHAPANIEHALAGASLRTRWNPALNLDTELRHHLVPRVHAFVDGLLQDAPPGHLATIARELRDGGHRFLVTTDLDAAKQYLRERYGEAPRSRYGLLASSKDKLLLDWGVDNTFQTTKRLRAGPWFNQPPSGPLSCCRLDTVATEFVAQGLELDMALLAWGTDFVRENGAWTNRHARGTKGRVHDTLALRRNSYRVLLTRGRDGTVLFVPPVGELNETLAYLERAGVERLA